MINYAFRRILSAIPTLFLLATLVFFLLRLAPGGPFDTDRVNPPEVQANLEKQFDLDKPLPQQYANWMKSVVFHGDFKNSMIYTDTPVTEMIRDSLPVSLALGGLALVLSILIGVPLGCISAWKQNTWMDSSAMFIAVSGVSIPSYLLASILVLVFSLGLQWLPPALWEGPSSAVLPVITLALRPMAIVARLTRASMIEALTSDYVRTAYSKGLTSRVVIFKHALKNSLIPVLAIMGPMVANLVTGSFIVENIFQIPGLGKHFVGAILNRDFNLAMGVTLIFGLFVVICTLVTDLASAWADPRIRLGED
ncbi:MAG: ABC transporter permease [Methylotenera sp.]|nr:ABC transporter permease [Oligoflexia bacterium]